MAIVYEHGDMRINLTVLLALAGRPQGNCIGIDFWGHECH